MPYFETYGKYTTGKDIQIFQRNQNEFEGLSHFAPTDAQENNSDWKENVCDTPSSKRPESAVLFPEMK